MGESCTALWERSSLLFAKSVIPPWPAVTLPWEESCLDRSACLWELPAARPLSLSLSLSISLSLCLFFSLFCSLPLPQHSPLSPYTSIYCTLSYHTGSLSPFCPSSLMFTSSFFSALSFFYSKLHSCITQHQGPPHPRPSHPRHRRLFFFTLWRSRGFAKWRQISSNRENKHTKSCHRQPSVRAAEQDQWHTGERKWRKKMTSGIDLARVEARAETAKNKAPPRLLVDS